MNYAAAVASHRRLLNGTGTRVSVTVLRLSGTGPSPTTTSATVDGRAMNFDPTEFAGPMQQGDRNVLIMMDDLAAQSFPVPLQLTDFVVISGKRLKIKALDLDTRRIEGRTVAAELTVGG